MFKRTASPFGPPGGPAPVCADAGPVRRSVGTGLRQPRSRAGGALTTPPGSVIHCDIGAGEGAAATSELNRQRLAWFQEHYRQVLPEVAHLVLYNSGSLLDPQEMPADLLDEVLVWARSLPALRMVSLETRESAVTERSLAAWPMR